MLCHAMPPSGPCSAPHVGTKKSKAALGSWEMGTMVETTLRASGRFLSLSRCVSCRRAERPWWVKGGTSGDLSSGGRWAFEASSRRERLID